MKPHGGLPIVSAGAPLAEGGRAMIMVHGRGAGPQNILDLVPALGHPEFSYLAPTAADNTWYPYSFMSVTGKNEPGLSSALAVLGNLVEDLVVRGIHKKDIVLLGFSQGACLSSEFAVRHADRFGGLILFSGGLIGPPGTIWKYPGSFAGTPVFLGCSDMDAHIPKGRVKESAAVFVRMGAEVTKRLYPDMGHVVNDDEIAFARAMMDSL